MISSRDVGFDGMIDWLVWVAVRRWRYVYGGFRSVNEVVCCVAGEVAVDDIMEMNLNP